ncbi:MAG: AAA family ATPase [Byssovorax sp.]
MSLEAFGVKNLRCLRDTGFVPLKPISLLVGRNSSGKSTFLRSFPLLRQSVETARESPILWYDPKYVDFGSLDEATTHGAKEPSVTFRFRVRLNDHIWVIGTPTFDVSAGFAEGERGAYLSSYDIRIEDHTILMKFGPDRTLIKYEVDSFDVLPKEDGLVSGGDVIFLPVVQPREQAHLAFIPVSRAPFDDIDMYEDQTDIVLLWNAAEEALGQLVSALAPVPVAWSPPVIGSTLEMAARLNNTIRYHQESKPNTGQFTDLPHDHPDLRRVMALWVAALIPSVLDATDLSVARWLSQVTYLAPFRVNVSRSYRMQEISVEEVDPQGHNLSMFLQSLSPQEADDFAAFTRTYLDFETRVRRERLNVEILIKERGADRFVNLVDVGFGYSEILPFALTLWATCVRRPRGGDRRTSMLAIEQPELHLHPAHQALLARMIAGALLESRKAGHEVKLMIETHSEALINGLGDLIAEGQLAADDAQIVLFEQDSRTRLTEVRLAGYDHEGALLDWPYGFFAPVRDEPLVEPLPLAGEE